MAGEDSSREIASLAGELQEYSSDPNQNTASNRSKIIQTARKLQCLAEGPEEYLNRLRFQVIENICMMVAVETGILDGIVSKEGAAVASSELAGILRLDEDFIVRIMRMLTSIGVCDERGPQLYASNSIAETLNSPGFSGGVKLLNTNTFPIATNLLDHLQARTRTAQEASDATTISCDLPPNFFQRTYGQTYWSYLDSHPDLKSAFDAYMTATMPRNQPQWFDVFPVREFEPELRAAKTDDADQEVLLVDVAGGVGHDMLQFHERFPDLPGRLVLQDLPATLAHADAAALEGKVEVMAYNFFTPQPVKGAHLYLLRRILHDWPTHLATAILSNVAAAMHPFTSLLLINECVLPDEDASTRAAAIDVTMMLKFGGMERTRGQWEGLLAGVRPRVRVEGVWSGEGVEKGVVGVRRVG